MRPDRRYVKKAFRDNRRAVDLTISGAGHKIDGFIEMAGGFCENVFSQTS
jgi:hypothetical protein